MPSTFVASVFQSRRKVIIESTVSVNQLTSNGLYIPVASIYDSADPLDHRRTEIRFAGGFLDFVDVYDGPVVDQVVADFGDENHGRTGLSLHYFPFAKKSYLCSSDGFFPIKKSYDHSTFQITVYSSSAIPQEDGLLFSVLATVTQTRKFKNGFEYIVQAENAIPVSLLMAIFSLPFTLPLLNIH